MTNSNRYIARLVQNFQRLKEQTFCQFIEPVGSRTITWSALERDCKRYLGRYQEAGVAPSTEILIFLRHTPDLYASYFGAMLGGLVPSFMPCSSPKQDPQIYWASHKELLNHIRPGAIVASTDTFEEMKAAGLDFGRAKRIPIDAIGALAGELSSPPEEAIALLQHSSGTTGRKKGVALSYDAIADQVESYGEAIRVADNDVIVSWLPLYHDMGLIACCVLPAYFGIPIVHLDPFHWLAKPDLLFDCIDKYSGTLTWLPNFAFEHLVRTERRRAERFRLGGMKAFINCSEPCKAKTFDRFLEAFSVAGVRPAHLQCCYAMAESVFAVSQTRIGSPVNRLTVDSTALDRGMIPIDCVDNQRAVTLLETGQPISGISVTIHDEGHAVLPDGVVGEIGLSGKFMFSGYNKNPRETARKCHGGIYFTGDVGFLREGHLYILGRTDDMIVINGRNLFAHEVESVLANIDGLKAGRSVALSVFDETQGTSVLALIGEKERTASRSEAEIRSEILMRVFSTFAIHPRRVELVDEGWLVKTTSGKISRKENITKLLQKAQ